MGFLHHEDFSRNVGPHGPYFCDAFCYFSSQKGRADYGDMRTKILKFLLWGESGSVWTPVPTCEWGQPSGQADQTNRVVERRKPANRNSTRASRSSDVRPSQKPSVHTRGYHVDVAWFTQTDTVFPVVTLFIMTVPFSEQRPEKELKQLRCG